MPMHLLSKLMPIALAACALSVAMPAISGELDSRYLTAKKSISAPAGFSAVCRQYPWACASGTKSSASRSSVLALAGRINSEVNRSIRQVTDQAQYGRNDYWTLPTSGRGDCEDFALLKKRKLIDAGVPASDLLIATALANKGRKLHAVLVLRTDRGDFVLDNLRNGIRSWKATGYTFLTMQRPGRPSRWDAIFAGGRIKSKTPVS